MNLNNLGLKFKVRIYAMFQYFSLLAMLLIVIGIALVLINANFKNASSDWGFWGDKLKDVLSFGVHDSVSQFGSTLVYIGFVLVLLTWAMGWTLFLLKDRNFYDQLFLLFVCIPVFSNVFALMAQLTLNTHKFTNSKLEKEDIEKEKTKIINLFEAKKKRLQREIKLHENELVKVEATLDSTPDIQLALKKQNVSDKKAKVTGEKKATVKVESKEEKDFNKKATSKKPTSKKVEAKKAPIKKATATKKPAAKKK